MAKALLHLRVSLCVRDESTAEQQTGISPHSLHSRRSGLNYLWYKHKLVWNTEIQLWVISPFIPHHVQLHKMYHLDVRYSLSPWCWQTKDKHKLPKEHHSNFPATLNSMSKIRFSVRESTNSRYNFIIYFVDAHNSQVTPKATGWVHSETDTCDGKHSFLLLRLVYTQRFLLTECN